MMSERIEFFSNEGDNFAPYVNEALLSLDVSLHIPLNKLFTIFKSIKLSKPNKKFETTSYIIIEKIIGIENYKIISEAIIEILINSPPMIEPYYNKKILLSKYNTEIFKNFIFSLVPLLDNAVIDLLRKLIIKHHELIPSIANASIYTISRYKNNYSISTMAIIRSKVKSRQVQKLINKYITETANSLNISIYELEDISVPDFGLKIEE